MKKHALIVTFICLGLALLSQNPTNLLIEKDKGKVAQLIAVLETSYQPTSPLQLAGKYRIDSLIGGYDENGTMVVKTGKNVFAYDENGYPKEASIYYWNNGSFIPYSRYLFSFSTEGKIENFLWQYLDNTYELWRDYSQSTYVYDSEGKLIEVLYYVTENWIDLTPSERIIYTYDASDLLVSRLDQGFEDNEWTDQYEVRYLYDESGNLLSQSSWNLANADQALELFRTEYTHNLDYRLTSEIRYTYNFYEAKIEVEEKDTLIYDQQQRLSAEINYLFYNEGRWLYSTKTAYSYLDHTVPYLIQHFFESEPGEWTLLSKNDIALDKNKDIFSKTMFSSSEENGLSPRLLYEYERKDDILLRDLHPGSMIWLDSWVFNDLDFSGAQKGSYAISRYGVYRWDDANTQWKNSDAFGDLFFYYSSLTTSSTDRNYATNKLLVYPNPVDRWLIVETDVHKGPLELYLYDIHGRRIFRKSISSQEQVILPILPEGTYVLQLLKDQDVLGSQKIIVRH